MNDKRATGRFLSSYMKVTNSPDILIDYEDEEEEELDEEEEQEDDLVRSSQYERRPTTTVKSFRDGKSFKRPPTSPQR